MFISRGDDWKRLRSIASPTFTSGKMKKMYPSIRSFGNLCQRRKGYKSEGYARKLYYGCDSDLCFRY